MMNKETLKLEDGDDASQVLSKIEGQSFDEQNISSGNLLFDFNTQRGQITQGNNKKSTKSINQGSQHKIKALSGYSTQRLNLFEGSQSQNKDLNFLNTQNFTSRNTAFNQYLTSNQDLQSVKLLENPPYLYKTKIIKSKRNSSHQQIRVNSKTLNKNSDLLTPNQNDATKESDKQLPIQNNGHFDLIRNFNKIAAGKLGQDQSQEFKQYLQQSKNRALQRYQSQLASILEKQRGEDNIGDTPKYSNTGEEYNTNETQKIVKNYSQKIVGLQPRSLTNEDIKQKLMQTQSLLQKSKNKKLVNIYDRSIYYQDVKDHRDLEKSKLSDLGKFPDKSSRCSKKIKYDQIIDQNYEENQSSQEQQKQNPGQHKFINPMTQIIKEEKNHKLRVILSQNTERSNSQKLTNKNHNYFQVIKSSRVAMKNHQETLKTDNEYVWLKKKLQTIKNEKNALNDFKNRVMRRVQTQEKLPQIIANNQNIEYNIPKGKNFDKFLGNYISVLQQEIKDKEFKIQ
eukprot:403357314